MHGLGPKTGAVTALLIRVALGPDTYEGEVARPLPLFCLQRSLLSFRLVLDFSQQANGSFCTARFFRLRSWAPRGKYPMLHTRAYMPAQGLRRWGVDSDEAQRAGGFSLQLRTCLGLWQSGKLCGPLSFLEVPRNHAVAHVGSRALFSLQRCQHGRPEVKHARLKQVCVSLSLFLSLSLSFDQFQFPVQVTGDRLVAWPRMYC